MTPTFYLVLTIITIASGGGVGVATTSFPQYGSKEQCEDAGKDWAKNTGGMLTSTYYRCVSVGEMR